MIIQTWPALLNSMRIKIYTKSYNIANNSFCKSELKKRVMESETKLIVSFNYAS